MGAHRKWSKVKEHRGRNNERDKSEKKIVRGSKITIHKTLPPKNVSEALGATARAISLSVGKIHQFRPPGPEMGKKMNDTRLLFSSLLPWLNTRRKRHKYTHGARSNVVKKGGHTIQRPSLKMFAKNERGK